MGASTRVGALTPPYLFGASVIGPLHVRNGLPCQDACAYEVFETEVGVIVAADGLGSAAKSESGARTAVDAAVAGAKEILSSRTRRNTPLDDVVSTAAFSSRRALENQATSELCELRDLACTIIVVAWRRDAIAIAHIGDGAVVGLSDGRLTLLSGPNESEYTNEVVPITAKNWTEGLRVSPPIDGVECFGVMTDGCQRAAFLKVNDSLIPHAGFFDPVFTYARELQDIKEGEDEIRSLLSSQKVCANSDDDKTLVIGVLRHQRALPRRVSSKKKRRRP